MKIKIFRPVMFVLYGLALVFVAAVAIHGWDYYALPLIERPRNPLHTFLKPGGLWGHGFGIFGSTMILLLFLYSARKRELFCLRFGRMNRWLNVHIFFGITGPVLITLHTAMKFNGIVSISYFSMLAVMFSGILGRYIYMQIPRNPAGEAMTMEQITAEDRRITAILVEKYQLPPKIIRHIQEISGAHKARSRKGLSALFAILIDDLYRPALFRELRRMLREQNLRIPPAAIEHIVRTAKKKSVLLRKCAFLDTVNNLFHYWHVIHKPFAYVMIIIMFLHILLTVTFGYRWIF
ncbi:MAG: hypothetical protein ACE5I1_08615 [bacterium]